MRASAALGQALACFPRHDEGETTRERPRPGKDKKPDNYMENGDTRKESCIRQRSATRGNAGGGDIWKGDVIDAVRANQVLDQLVALRIVETHCLDGCIMHPT